MPCGSLVACQGLVFLDMSAFGRLLWHAMPVITSLSLEEWCLDLPVNLYGSRFLFYGRFHLAKTF